MLRRDLGPAFSNKSIDEIIKYGVSIRVADQHAELGMKYSCRAGDGFDLVVPTSPARSLLTETSAYAFRVGKDQCFATTAAQQRVQQHRLEEREA